MAELYSYTVGQLARLIQTRQVSPLEVTKSVIDRIEKIDGRLKSYVTVSRDEAMESAKGAERAIMAGQYLGPLHGIPIALKDNVLTKGILTTYGSKVLSDFVPTYDATITERFKQAGAVMVGKTNPHEFAWGVFSPPTKNPWDLERDPGGSSGGSAAAVAADLAIAAIGTDTGGSIRIPGSLCGIVGLKQTYGRVSKFGVMSHSYSLDHAGPMTKNVEDAALVLQAIAGWDPRDPSTANVPVPNYSRALTGMISRIRLGIPKEHFYADLDPEVQQAVEKAIKVLQGLGASVEEFSMPHLKYGLAAILAVELTSSTTYHARYMKRIAEYQPDVRTLVELGLFMLATDYLKAEQLRRVLINEAREAFKRVDVMITPTEPIPAWKTGQATIRIGAKDVSVLDASWRNTFPYNLTGLPAITVPCGFSRTGLPIGLQIAGKPFDEETVLRVAHAYELNTDWHSKKPSL